MDFDYILFIMIYLVDVMGVSCFEMLSVCLRLWRMEDGQRPF